MGQGRLQKFNILKLSIFGKTGKLITAKMDRVKRIWYLSPMRAAKVQASLRIRAVSPEPPLLAHTSSESRGTFRLKARSLAPLDGWACSVEICHDGMLEDTNLLDGAQMIMITVFRMVFWDIFVYFYSELWMKWISVWSNVNIESVFPITDSTTDNIQRI